MATTRWGDPKPWGTGNRLWGAADDHQYFTLVFGDATTTTSERVSLFANIFGYCRGGFVTLKNRAGRFFEGNG